MESESYDVVVVGGSAAGLSAALVLGRARRRVAVVDAGTPRNGPAAHMHGFLSRDGMRPTDLLAAARAEVRSYGVELVDDRVLEITSGFSVQLAGGRSIAARRLLLATGAVDELPDIPGARERWGRDFLHCPYCHGWEVLIFFSHTHPVTASERAALDARGIPVIEGLVACLSVANDRLDAVQLADGREIPRAAVFIRPALHARRDGLIDSLGCEVDEGGFVRVDTNGGTSVPGVWGGRQRQQPTRAGDHRRRRGICRRHRNQRRPRRGGRPCSPAERHHVTASGDGIN